MDDPGPNTPIRLRRSCEHNRLEKQLLVNAYETLVVLIPSEEKPPPKGGLDCHRSGTDRRQARLAEIEEPAA